MPFTFPETLGACIDAAYSLREKRLELQRELEVKIKAIKKEEDALEEHILQKFDNSEIEGARGNLATAGRKVSNVPVVENWDEFYEYVRENRAFDLLQKRPTTSAFRERWDENQTIPGTKMFTKIELTLNKR
jgi:predicted metal-binding protein